MFDKQGVKVKYFTRLGIYDGCEMLAYIIGTSLSSPVNKRFGNYGTYVVSIVLCSLSVAYMIIFIKEPKRHYRVVHLLFVDIAIRVAQKYNNFIFFFANAKLST